MAKRIEFEWKVLDGVLQLGANKVQCTHILGCSAETIEDRIEKEHGMTFTEYRESKFTATKVKLVQSALTRAFSGKSDTMLIFCLKNLCGWKNEGPDEELEALKKELAAIMAQLQDLKAKAA